MPTYEYACTQCGHQLEAWQKMSDAPLTDCPQCGASTLQKRISGGAFHLKGSGWYETDFKGKPKAEPTPAAVPACASGACNACVGET